MFKKTIILFELISLSYGKLYSESTKFFADSESEIRFFGWLLLGLWISTILYMTRDFFFPSIFSHEILPISASNIDDDLQKFHLKTVLEEDDESITVASNTIVRYRHSDSTVNNNEQVFL